ncbi:hypothetical protein ROT00_07120 [Agromyces mediolanus]|uniref:hypothetical protein n=1 Tax=Agromyces mediolanus TaxID=41986 RepID=UPI003837A3B5
MKQLTKFTATGVLVSAFVFGMPAIAAHAETPAPPAPVGPVGDPNVPTVWTKQNDSSTPSGVNVYVSLWGQAVYTDADLGPAFGGSFADIIREIQRSRELLDIPETL